ncbi:MAG: glycogen/starch synthase [Armatimonadota bacterium]|nr:glycogen/starch synthase [Armatimonadota bacterium]
MQDKLKILVVSVEVAPFAKVGGLADVAGSLPQYLSSLGHDVRVAMPCYRMIESNPKYNAQPFMSEFPVPINDKITRIASAKTTSLGKVPVYLIENKEFFGAAVDSKSVYRTGADPYIFFCRAVLEMVRRMDGDWVPDVIHCNDWHTGLLPVYLRTLYANDPRFNNIASVFTIHNLAYQGEFDFETLAAAGLPEKLYNMDMLECYGRVNFMKGGIVFSDLVNTVSETYAKEIQTPEYGCRLEGLLTYMASLDKLRGALNGIDYNEFNPATDDRIWAKFSSEDLSAKSINKAKLQETQGLPVKANTPLIGLVSRLVDQKGLDLVRAAAPYFLKQDVQLIILGSGDPVYEDYFKKLQEKHPDKVSVTIGFDAILAQRIYAGCDLFLMPSRFEPCGLGQMISLRYATVPMVRATGGLADTVIDFNPKTGGGNGFVFTEYQSKALLDTIKRAITTYGDSRKWSKLLDNAVSSDFSGLRSAENYSELYTEAVKRARAKSLCICA